MRPAQLNLKKYFHDWDRKVNSRQLEVDEASRNRLMCFNRFSGECGERHTTSNYYECMHKTHLMKQFVPNNNKVLKYISFCTPNECPLLKGE